MENKQGFIQGVTVFRTLTQGVDAPYYGRGAVRRIRLIQPKDEEPYYFALFDRMSGKLIGQSDTDGVLDVERDIDKVDRFLSFRDTTLPYDKVGVTAANFFNLSSVTRLNVTLSRLSEKNAIFEFEQEWVQLVGDDGKPLVKTHKDLVAAEETPIKYVPLVKYDFRKEIEGTV
jgi:hypothetical protein